MGGGILQLFHFLFIGLTAIQIKRFQRCWKNAQPSRSPIVGQNLKLLKDSGKKSTPWREKKFGYIPHPQTTRAKFLNEKLLCQLYDSKWKWSKNSWDFVKQFHAEGRRQYDLHQSLESLKKNLQSILDTNIQQSAATLLTEDKTLCPSDSQSIKFNIQRLEDLNKKEKTLKRSLKLEDEKLFVKSGKICTGEQCAHKYNEEWFSNLLKLKSDQYCHGKVRRNCSKTEADVSHKKLICLQEAKAEGKSYKE